MITFMYNSGKQNSSKEFYVYTPSAEAMLVEIFEESKVVSLIIGNNRIDLRIDSALELADALLMTVNDAWPSSESW